MKPGIKLRCDGSNKIGLGHIYRMIALSNLLENDFECSFIVRNPDEKIIELLEENNCKLQVLDEKDLNSPGINYELNEPLRKNEILVLDGYHFDTMYQYSVKNNIGCKLVCIDDIISFPFIGDIVINPAGGITESEYDVPSHSKLLLGPKYAILRKEFYEVNEERKTNKRIENIFVNFGGADPDNVTCKVIKELLTLPFLPSQINVVIGPAFQHHQELQAIAEKDFLIKIYQNVKADGIVDLMKVADLAICSSSTIAYEFCSVSGLLLIIQTALNQSGLYNFLIEERLALPYEKLNEIYSGAEIKVEELILNQRKYFDGLAGVRLRKEFMRLYIKNNYFLRRAVAEDIDLYFKWANDKEVRRNSFNPNPISYEEHCDWFMSHISAKDSCLYVFSSGDNIPLASIRFKIENDAAILSYLIDERYRGIGFGKAVLAEGTNKFYQENRSITKVVGFVKDKNLASIKAFNTCGFEETESTEKNVKCFTKTFKNE